MYRNEILIANVPYTLNHPYSYTSEIPLDFGMLVNISFGKTKTYGIVISSEPMDQTDDSITLKPIDSLVNHHCFLSDIQYRLGITMAYQGFTSLGKLLVQMIPSFLRVDQPFAPLMQARITINASMVETIALTKGQKEILAWLNQTHCDDYTTLIHQFSYTRIHTLLQKDVLTKSYHLPKVVAPRFKAPFHPDDTVGQKSILYRLDLHHFISGPLLSLIYQGIANTQSTIIIAPSLLSAKQVYQYLSEKIEWIDLYDPSLSDTNKRLSYYRFTHGQTTVTVGTKSLLLLKPDADQIIILQANDGAYLQDNDPRIHVDEILETLMDLTNPRIVLQTLIPTLDMVETMNQHKMDMIEDNMVLPIESVDMKMQPNNGEFSSIALNWLDQMVQTNGHIVISTSRKGWYYHVECQHCHKPLVCPHCNQLLQSSQQAGVYQCVHCGKTIKRQRCIHCHHGKWIYKKPGVKALVEQLKKRYPSMDIYGLNNDIADGLESIDAFEKSKASILLTTHSILSNVIVHADGLIMLHGDSALAYRQYRNDEWAMHYCINALHNVIPFNHGSTIRIVQFDYGDHPLNGYLKNQDIHGYIQYEQSYRRQMVQPPYTHIALIKQPMRYGLDALGQCIHLKPDHGSTIGPAESKSDNTYRLILRCNSLSDLQDWLSRWYNQLNSRYQNGLTILINPNSMPND